MFDKSRQEELEARRDRPVKCLGIVFENDEARRDHFLDKLREGLEELHAVLGGVPYAGVDDTVARIAAIEHWPMGEEGRLRELAERMRHADSSKDLLQRWKDEVGFPHGEIDNILKLSDPPWHTACPNPFLGAFVGTYGRAYDPEESYRRKPFAVDVSEGKTHPVYRAHGYHTKVPHLAIVPSILHYTEPGDLVLDGFAGSGMTGVAAQWCGTAPESYRKSLEALWAKEGFGTPKWGLRRTIQNDLSPLAGFIAANYGLPFDVDAFTEAGRALLDEAEAEVGWMYETLHSDGETRGRIDYTVWSEVFGCPECASEIVFLEEAWDRTTGRVRDTFPCPDCNAELNKDRLERVFESDMDAATGDVRKHVTFRPELIRYTVGGGTFEKRPDADDRELVRRIAELPLSADVPTNRLPIEDMYHGSRLAPKGCHSRPPLLSPPVRTRPGGGVAPGQCPSRYPRPSYAALFRGAGDLGTVDPQSIWANTLLTSEPSTKRRILHLIANFRGLSEIQSWKQVVPAHQDIRPLACSSRFRVCRHGKYHGVAWASRRRGRLHLHRPAVRREHLLRRSQPFGRVLAWSFN